MKMVKFRFAFAHFVLVFLSLLLLNGGKWCKSKISKFRVAKAKWAKPVWQKQKFPYVTSLSVQFQDE
jgi:hypothetical protein